MGNRLETVKSTDITKKGALATMQTLIPGIAVLQNQSVLDQLMNTLPLLESDVLEIL